MRLHKLNELAASEHRAVVAVLCIIGALAVHNWLVSPHMASLRAAQQYERATSTVMDKSKVKNQQLQAKREAFDRLLAERTALAEGIFRPDEVEPFFNELEHLCTETQCAVVLFSHAEESNSIRHGVGDANEPVSQRTAKLTLQAGYGNVVRLVEKLQTYPRRVWIDRLQIVYTPEISGVTCDLEISIYVHRSKENEDHE
jgi:type II secretory pathway pseudopilin PulG